MPYPGRADSSGVVLVVTIDSGWTLTLQRRDFKPDGALTAYFGRELSGHDLRALLPDWSALTWRHHSAGLFHPSEWSATNDVYLLRLTHPSSSDDARAAIAAFTGLISE